MSKNSTQPNLGMPNLTVIRKSDEKVSDAKLISITKGDKKPKVILPPAREQYIKAKKHDFF